MSEVKQKVVIDALPDGFHLVAVNHAFGDLMYWLDRCERKGHLENCPDLVDPWEEFDYRDLPYPQADAQQINSKDIVITCETGSVPDADLIEWAADRMVHVYGEPEHIDFVLALKRIAAKVRSQP